MPPDRPAVARVELRIESDFLATLHLPNAIADHPPCERGAEGSVCIALH